MDIPVHQVHPEEKVKTDYRESQEVGALQGRPDYLAKKVNQEIQAKTDIPACKVHLVHLAPEL